MDEFNEQSETGCCPRFNPETWDGKEITFEDKLFLRDHVRSIFHIPLNFGKVMTRSMEKIEET
ncbi:MAG TPA: hydrolase, partial [archaeon]|nr:hydrolase [archaeon]